MMKIGSISYLRLYGVFRFWILNMLMVALRLLPISEEFFGAGRHHSVIFSKALGGDMGIHCAFIF